MKIALISTSDSSGGAAIACVRLHRALRKEGIDSKVIVQSKNLDDETIIDTAPSFISKKLAFLRHILEKIHFIFFEKSKAIRFAFTTANTGINISSNEAARKADIIHLHWFYMGYLSLSSLRKLAKLNVPVVWTLHDMWAFTGGCFHTRGCNNYKYECGNCQFLQRPAPNDLSNRIWQRKLKVMKELNPHIVTCSKWLGDKARESSLMKGLNINTIPNPINTEKFRPAEKIECKKELGLHQDKIYLGFVSPNLANKYKGGEYLIRSLELLFNENPEYKDQIEILIIGPTTGENVYDIPFKTHFAGHINSEDKMISYYNAMSIFLLPSLEENLPNTIMEAMSCGTPAVAFDTGGISDLIEHKHNGYLAGYKDSADLKKGIHWVLSGSENYKSVSDNAREKVLNNYSEEKIAKEYIKIYRSIKKG